MAGDATDLDACLASRDGELGGIALFDTVFVDAPCSGTGTMRRHGEIPWRLHARGIRSRAARLQLEMLCEAACRVAPAMGAHLRDVLGACVRRTAMSLMRFLGSPEGEGFALVPAFRCVAR